MKPIFAECFYVVITISREHKQHFTNRSAWVTFQYFYPGFEFFNCEVKFRVIFFRNPIRDPSILQLLMSAWKQTMLHLPLHTLLWINDRAEWTGRSGSRKRDISLIPFYWCLFPLSLVFRFSFESQCETGIDAEQKRLVFGRSGSGDLQMYIFPFSLHGWIFWVLYLPGVNVLVLSSSRLCSQAQAEWISVE